MRNIELFLREEGQDWQNPSWGGIMRGLRTVPHLWSVAADMAELCPDATLLQYVNPMAINTWALAEQMLEPLVF